MNQVRYVLLVVTVVALVGVSALALTVPNTFVSGEVISAAEMNANFAAVEAAVAELQVAQPVVAYRYRASDFQLDNTSAVAEDVVVVSIEAPATGVVVVEATSQARWAGTTNANYFVFVLDTEPGGSLGIASEFGHVVGTSYPGGTMSTWNPVAIQRVFSVPAGTHEFRLKARALTADGNKHFWNTSIRATWYPAGSVDLQSVDVASVDGFGNQ